MGLHHDDVPEPAGGHPGAFLELDKTREAAYMREHGYRFRAIAHALPVSSEQLRVLDIGTTPCNQELARTAVRSLSADFSQGAA
jgi:hypothetical protein